MTYVWTGLPGHGDAWRCLLSALFPGEEIKISLFSDASYSNDILGAFHVVEVWDASMRHAVGFPRGIQLAKSGLRVLLFFVRRPGPGFDDDGPCWITPHSKGGLMEKIEALKTSSPLGEAPLRDLAERYPELKAALAAPSHTGHHGHHTPVKANGGHVHG